MIETYWAHRQEWCSWSRCAIGASGVVDLSGVVEPRSLACRDFWAEVTDSLDVHPGPGHLPPLITPFLRLCCVAATARFFVHRAMFSAGHQSIASCPDHIVQISIFLTTSSATNLNAAFVLIR